MTAVAHRLGRRLGACRTRSRSEGGSRRLACALSALGSVLISCTPHHAAHPQPPTATPPGATVIAAPTTTTPPSTTTSTRVAPPTTLEVPPGVPPGWRPIDYYDLRLWTPPAWGVLGSAVQSCPPGPDPTIAFGFAIPQTTGCGPGAGPLPAATVGIEPKLVAPVDRAGAGGARAVAQPVPARGGPGSRSVQYPNLGVTVTTRGLAAAAVVATAGPSPRADALTVDAGSLAPATWAPVNYQGLSFRVPPDWPIINLDQTRGATPGTGCAFFSPNRVVHLGAGIGTASPGCASRPASGGVETDPGVWVVADDRGGPAVKTLMINGLHVDVLADLDPEGLLVHLAVQVPNARLSVYIGLDPNGATDRAITNSFRSGP